MNNKHYFKGNELYYLKDVIPYIKKKNPTLEIPDCWQTGGSLNEKVRTEYGIEPVWTNEIEGRGHREKYSGNQMYTIAANLVQDIKDGIIKRHQSRTPTPIEVLASSNPNKPEDFFEAMQPNEPIIVPVYAPTSKEDLEKALRQSADELVNNFQTFIQQIINAYIGGES